MQVVPAKVANSSLNNKKKDQKSKLSSDTQLCQSMINFPAVKRGHQLNKSVTKRPQLVLAHPVVSQCSEQTESKELIATRAVLKEKRHVWTVKEKLECLHVLQSLNYNFSQAVIDIRE